LKAGASGVIQGMVLSFGGLRFRNSHLEFNTEPKDLHRDYHFRLLLSFGKVKIYVEANFIFQIAGVSGMGMVLM